MTGNFLFLPIKGSWGFDSLFAPRCSEQDNFELVWQSARHALKSKLNKHTTWSTRKEAITEVLVRILNVVQIPFKCYSNIPLREDPKIYKLRAASGLNALSYPRSFVGESNWILPWSIVDSSSECFWGVPVEPLPYSCNTNYQNNPNNQSWISDEANSWRRCLWLITDLQQSRENSFIGRTGAECGPKASRVDCFLLSRIRFPDNFLSRVSIPLSSITRALQTPRLVARTVQTSDSASLESIITSF